MIPHAISAISRGSALGAIKELFVSHRGAEVTEIFNRPCGLCVSVSDETVILTGGLGPSGSMAGGADDLLVAAAGGAGLAVDFARAVADGAADRFRSMAGLTGGHKRFLRLMIKRGKRTVRFPRCPSSHVPCHSVISESDTHSFRSNWPQRTQGTQRGGLGFKRPVAWFKEVPSPLARLVQYAEHRTAKL